MITNLALVGPIHQFYIIPKDILVVTAGLILTFLGMAMVLSTLINEVCNKGVEIYIEIYGNGNYQRDKE